MSMPLPTIGNSRDTQNLKVVLLRIAEYSDGFEAQLKLKPRQLSFRAPDFGARNLLFL
jgi:hypothetical protein